MSDTLSASSEQAISELLKRELYRLVWWGVAALAGGSILLGMVWHWGGSLQWLLQAGLIWAFICFQTRRRLPMNRAEQEAPLYRELGWANRLTLLRAWLIATVAGFLFQPWPEGPVLVWMPGMLYFGAAVLDRVDGYVARRTQHGSLLGNELDTVSDALGLAIASLLALGYGQVHWSYLLIGIAYYWFQAGIMWRKTRGLPVYTLPQALHRRAWAGFQMGFLVVALWPLFYPPVTSLAGFAFMLPVLIGFAIDWLIVSGHINRQTEEVDLFFRRLTNFSQTVLQPAMRIVIVILLTVSLAQSGVPPLSGEGASLSSVIHSSGFVLAALLIILGIAGRVISLAMLGLLGWYYIEIPLQSIDYVLFCSVVWLMLLGTGRFSLWLEDDHWINRYDGL